MKFRALTARCALMAAFAVSSFAVGAAPAMAQFWQCVPYARSVSGIQLRGNANTWWGQAAGRYARGHAPKAGAVLSFAASGRMPMGHVAMVSEVVSEREVRLIHANWSHPGRVETDVRAVDVSAAGDWSRVKVWYAGNGGLGTTSYVANGFIYADGAPDAQDAFEAPVTIAQVDEDAANGVLSLIGHAAF